MRIFTKSVSLGTKSRDLGSFLSLLPIAQRSEGGDPLSFQRQPSKNRGLHALSSSPIIALNLVVKCIIRVVSTPRVVA